ncbi:hypothetical protein Dimus_013248 [Dionaea muscipula]
MAVFDEQFQNPTTMRTEINNNSHQTNNDTRQRTTTNQSSPTKALNSRSEEQNSSEVSRIRPHKTSNEKHQLKPQSIPKTQKTTDQTECKLIQSEIRFSNQKTDLKSDSQWSIILELVEH